MHKLLCSTCGLVSYTADTSQAQKCPHCTEKYLVVNEDFMELLKSYNSGDLKLVINRRKADRRIINMPVENERRFIIRRKTNALPIGWLMLKHSNMTV